MTKLTTIEGIGPAYAKTMKESGINTVDVLLNAGSTKKGRQQIAEKTGLAEKVILRWVNYADLFRIKGVAGEYAELLEAAGVDTVPELAQRNPANLREKMMTVNNEKKLVRQLPSESSVGRWVVQAKTLPRVINY